MPPDSFAQKAIHWLGLILAITTAILSTADLILPITQINPTLAHAWPLFICFTQALDRMAKIFTKYLGGTLASLALYIIAGLMLYGCATTKVYSKRTGKPLFATGADSAEITYTGEGSTLHIVQNNHSTTNKITADGIQKGIAAGGAAAALLKP